MTYFSDFEPTDYYYSDEQLRKDALRQVDDIYLEPFVEDLPESIFDNLDLPFFIEAKDNSWLTQEQLQTLP